MNERVYTPVNPLNVNTTDNNEPITYQAQVFFENGQSIITHFFSTPREALLNAEEQMRYTTEAGTLELWKRVGGTITRMFTVRAEMHLVLGDGTVTVDNIMAQDAIEDSPLIPTNVILPELESVNIGVACRCPDCVAYQDQLDSQDQLYSQDDAEDADEYTQDEEPFGFILIGQVRG